MHLHLQNYMYLVYFILLVNTKILSDSIFPPMNYFIEVSEEEVFVVEKKRRRRSREREREREREKTTDLCKI